jgi:histidine kinase
MIAASTGEEPLPAGTEGRLADFTELVATAIANAEAQAELTASRARIVATADQARRRIERDLHDGAQQRLVSVALRLRTAAAAIPPEEEVQQELAGIGSELDDALDDLRELSRGIHPAILSEGGLGPALRTLARRSSVPVELQMGTKGRLPEPVEVAAYYVVAEALANVAKPAPRWRRSTLTPMTGSCGWRSATTGSGGPTLPAARGWSASRTGWRPPAARCEWRAVAGRAPGSWSSCRPTPASRRA